MKELCFILLLTNCSLLILNAQTQFQLTIGGLADDNTWPVRQAPDSGFVVAGYTNSFGAGASDFYVVRLSNNNVIQWTKTFGSTGSDILLSMVRSASGGYAISGETNSFGAGAFDIYAMKLDEEGGLLWAKTFGGAGEDYGECIIQTQEGGYAIGGYTNSYGSGDFDDYILKIDSAGNIQWMKTYGTPGYDYALYLIQTSDGGYALCGSTAFSGEGYTDFYIVKTDSNGSIQWSKTIGGAGGDYGSAIAQADDGGFIAAGVTISFGAGEYDLYIVKLDGNGNLLWTKTIGGSDFEYLYSIIKAVDGGIAASGSTASFGAGGDDSYILKLNSAGDLLWNRTIGGVYDDNARSIIQTSDGGYLIGGETGSWGAGNSDIYIIKTDANGNSCGYTSTPVPVTGNGGILGSPVSTITSPTPSVFSPAPATSIGGTLSNVCILGISKIGNEIPKSNSLSQNYPNPFNPSTKIKFDILSVGNGRDRSVQIAVYDISGKLVEILVDANLKPGKYEVEWNAAKYSSGVYFYKLVSGDYVETKKMILVK